MLLNKKLKTLKLNKWNLVYKLKKWGIIDYKWK